MENVLAGAQVPRFGRMPDLMEGQSRGRWYAQEEEGAKEGNKEG